MCRKERAAGMRQILEKLAKDKRISSKKENKGATISEGVSPPFALDGEAQASTSPAPFLQTDEAPKRLKKAR
jgi:hypothetical protein